MENSSSKTVGIVVVIIIVVAGIWLMTRKPSDDTTTMLPPAATQTQPVQTPSQTAPATPANGISASGTSDAALNQDSASINSQMQGLSSDNTAASQTVQ